MSSLLNVGHVFEYQLNDARLYRWNYGNKVSYAEPKYPDDLSIDSSLSVYIYLLFYFFINYVLFFVVNTWVEVTIVQKLHSELADKRTRLHGMEMKSMGKASPSNVKFSFRKMRRQVIEDGAENRAIIMVIINALINLVFSLPELLLFFAQSDQLMLNNFVHQFLVTFQSMYVNISRRSCLFNLHFNVQHQFPHLLSVQHKIQADLFRIDSCQN
jgi:hypothetical protein